MFVPHHRRSVRLSGFDYSFPGAYFVTICTKEREQMFGRVADGEMTLNEYGRIVENEWLRTAAIRPCVVLDSFAVMPNHFHGIMVLRGRPDSNVNIFDSNVGAWRAMPLRRDGDCHVAFHADEPRRRFGKPIPDSLSTIIGAFKSAVSKRINECRGTPGARIWQRNYYERIVRNDASLSAMREYIANNPLKWSTDENNT